MVPGVVRNLKATHSSRQGSSLSRCAPASTKPKIYAEYYATHAAV
jgi:hypothetical protein